MAVLPIKLYLIPGSGTDKRMFAPQLEAFPDIVIPEWIDPLSLKEPITSYAKRLAMEIDGSEPFILGGVSLGGMIAQEMARTLRPEGLILIATASSYKAIPFFKRLLARLTRALPDDVISLLWKSAAFWGAFSRLRHKDLYCRMLREMPPFLARWQSGASTEWKLKGKLKLPILRIHGGKDRIVRLGKDKPDRLIEEGGHLISVTHEKEVNDFIAESVARIMAKRGRLETMK